jgi:thiol-disulfide isomerase/thioredoxin
MKKLLTICCLLPLLTFAQTSQYKINGYSKTYNNQQIWISGPPALSYTEYYDIDVFIKLGTTVKDNRFSSVVETDCPMPLIIVRKEGNQLHYSNIFFIDKGTTNITVDSAGKEQKVTILHSKLTDEYNKQKHLFDSSFANSELSPVKLERFKLVKNYISQNPTSYAAFWLLLTVFCKEGHYSNELDSLSVLFAGDVIKSRPYKAFRQKLIGDKLTAVGNRFPFSFFSSGEEMEADCARSKYMLIDFWASYCKPCIAQFPDLKDIYQAFSTKGFSIWGVSIDRSVDSLRADTVINKFSLPWKHYFDVKGQKTAKINIQAIPDNFLLDANGIIIRRKISPEDLAAFLANELKPAGTASK